MIDIEKSSVYLSHETEPEFERFLKVLKKESSSTVDHIKEMFVEIANAFNRDKSDQTSYKVKEMRCSIHSYMLVATNRYID